MVLARRLQANPATRIDPIWLIRLAAWQPLLSAPGSRYHHSNVGWKIAGLIAANAGGKPLASLYQERIVEPLGLTHTAYQPQGLIDGSHVNSYSIAANGSLSEHAYPFGIGADGGVVTDASDEATFIQALVGGKLGVRQQLLDFYGARGSNGSGCPTRRLPLDRSQRRRLELRLQRPLRQARRRPAPERRPPDNRRHGRPERRGRRAAALLRHLRSRRDPPNYRTRANSLSSAVRQNSLS